MQPVGGGVDGFISYSHDKLSVRLLLDTHVLLWLRMDDPRLAPGILAMIGAPENTVLVSIASIWEIAVKVRIGKLTLSTDCRAIIGDRASPARMYLMTIFAPCVTFLWSPATAIRSTIC